MRIFGREVSFRRQKTELAAKNVVSQYPTGVATAQGFSTYKSIQGSQQLSFELIDDLYSRTIVNKIINKIAGDCTRMAYTTSYVDMEKKLNEELELVGLQIDIRLTRSVLRNIFRDQILYGTAFLFIKRENGVPIKTYTIHPQYITPVIENGELIAWEYGESGTPIRLTTEELICFPLDPKTGEIFGSSIFGALIQTLELFLNVQLDLSILVDRFALPIIMYTIDNGLEGVKETDEEILAFMKSLLEQLSYGSDVGVGSGISAQVLGTDTKLIDFIPILKDLKESLGIITGVPFALIGGSGDNLSISRMQMQSYLEYIRDIQDGVGDILIEELYKPFLEESGFIQLEDYREIYINWPRQSVEELSKTAVWLFPAIDKGILRRTEARGILGYKGEAVPVDEIEIIEQAEVVRPGARKPNDPTQDPEPKEPNDDDRDHDPNG